MNVMSAIARPVVTSHQEAAVMSQTPDKHHAVAAIVQRILAGKDGVRQ
jgi:hypothetical protein